jgi:hypothetical protein
VQAYIHFVPAVEVVQFWNHLDITTRLHPPACGRVDRAAVGEGFPNRHWSPRPAARRPSPGLWPDSPGGRVKQRQQLLNHTTSVGMMQCAFEILFRSSGPLPPLFNKTWVLPDIEPVK